jgi:hypothetical protein
MRATPADEVRTAGISVPGFYRGCLTAEIAEKVEALSSGEVPIRTRRFDQEQTV